MSTGREAGLSGKDLKRGSYALGHFRQTSADRKPTPKDLIASPPVEKPVAPSENRLLAAFPTQEYQRLVENSDVVSFSRDNVVYEAGDLISHAVFICRGIASVVAISQATTTVEVGIVGKEGFIGVPLILGADIGCYRVVAQTRVEGIKVDTPLLREQFNRSAKLQQVLLKYVNILNIQTVQSNICSAAHPLRRRLARWFLTTSDCLNGDVVDVTHEQLAKALGKHRNRIGLAISELEKEGVIECERANVTIVDRRELRNVSCECYRIIRDALMH